MVIIISIIIISVMSISIFSLISTTVQTQSTRHSTTADMLNNFGNLAEIDIQVILEEDSAKYETAYSFLNDLYLLNDQYIAMVEYNETHAFNYTQIDFDEVKMEFTLKMKHIINIIHSTSVYEYCTTIIGSDTENNYTVSGYEYLFIINRWNTWEMPYEPVHSDIFDFVNTTFTLASVPIDLPEIKLETWSYHLYNNLSIIEYVGPNSAMKYANNKLSSIDLTYVNLSLAKVSEYSDSYVLLSEKANSIIQDFNNTLITLALAGVLMGFATSFDSVKLRKISLVVGLLVLIIGILYFVTATANHISLAIYEAGIVGANEFVFA